MPVQHTVNERKMALPRAGREVADAVRVAAVQKQFVRALRLE